MRSAPLSLAIALAWGSLVLTPHTARVQAESPAGAPDQIELEPLERPNLDNVEAAVVRQLQDQLAKVEALTSDPTGGSRAAPALAVMADEMGRLGELYILYELLAFAEPAMINASRLAPADYRWHYFLGTITQEQRRLEEARAALTRALELKLGYLPALIRLGEIERAAGNTDRARRWYLQALEVAPSSPAANWGLGQLAYGGGDSETAVAHFGEVLAIQPGATAVHYPLALAYRDLGQLDKAREHLGQRGDVAIQKADPLVNGLAQLVVGSSLYMVRGNQAFSRGNLRMAVAAYRNAVEAVPDHVVAREALASALSRIGDVAGAMEQIDWVIGNGHASAGTYYNLATLQSLQGDAEESLSNFQQALDLDPDMVDAHYNLGLLLERLDRPTEALSHYERVIELDPQDSAARIRRATVLLSQRQLSEAERILRSVLKADPDNAESLLTLGELLNTAGRYEEAVDAYTRVAAASDDTELRARAHYGLGRLLLERGQSDAAIVELEQAVELMPRISEARLTLAGALGRSRRYPQAAAQYETLIQQNPAVETAHFGRAFSYLLAGRDAAAANALDQSLRRFTDDPGLRHLLARLLATSSDDTVRDGARALEMAQRLFSQQQDLQHAETLAMALAEVGRFSEAIELQSRIVAEARRQGGQGVPALETRLEGYRRGEATRAPWLEDG